MREDWRLVLLSIIFSNMKINKICINKNITYLSLGGLLIVGILIFNTSIGKINTANSARAAAPQCIYDSEGDCKSNCPIGYCTQKGCKRDQYKCAQFPTPTPTPSLTPTPTPTHTPTPSVTPIELPQPITCKPYGTKFYTTTSGKCWSIESNKVLVDRGDGWPYYTCLNEPAKETDYSLCPKPDVCVETINASMKGFDLAEYYEGPRFPHIQILHSNHYPSCYSYGLKRVADENGYGCLDTNTGDNIAPLEQCDKQKYKCHGYYKVIGDDCYFLRSRKCAKIVPAIPESNLSSYEINACCSDIVPMENCKKNAPRKETSAGTSDRNSGINE